MTLLQAVHRATEAVSRRDAETLLLHTISRDRTWLLAHPEDRLTPQQEQAFFALVERRASHVPLQYLTGHQEFFGLDLRVTPDVLIPRPETELLVEAVVDRVRQSRDAVAPRPLIVDVGTGSGAIALALATQLPAAEIWALDISHAALAVAGGNAEQHGLAARICFRHSDLLLGIAHEVVAAGSFDVVVSNPPYVPVGDASGMQPEVRDHEPHRALFAGEDGLEVYRRLIPQAWTMLQPGGLLALEIGYGQREALARLLHGWSEVTFLDDYAGIPRVALALRP